MALFRCCISLVIIFDMLDRWPDIYAWYSDEGTDFLKLEGLRSWLPKPVEQSSCCFDVNPSVLCLL